MPITIEQINPENSFRIGAVSRITNIPVDTLRIWERRYSVVTPMRTAKSDRLYSTNDITRLTLLKMLVDKGHAIGSIASLDDEQLRERLNVHDEHTSLTQKDDQSDSSKSVKVIIVGEVIPLLVSHNQHESDQYTITAMYHNTAEYHTSGDAKTDILILEYTSIQEEMVREIQQTFITSGAKKLILIYGFATSSAINMLKKKNYAILQAPVTLLHLDSEILSIIQKNKLSHQAKVTHDVNQAAPKRMFKNSTLIKLANMSSTIQCECPQHLSGILMKLNQFEAYSRECENRNDDDRQLHARIANATGHARSIMERSLQEIIVAEGIKLEDLKS